ncbi:MAG: tyrosine-type recombinase/integrase, partial [Actinomycetota bacterium]
METAWSQTGLAFDPQLFAEYCEGFRRGNRGNRIWGSRLGESRVRRMKRSGAPTTTANDIAELLAEFKIMLQATNRSPATITAYMAGVEALRRYLVERGMPTAVDAIAREHVEAAYAGWIEGGYAAASVKNRHDGIRQFFAWCEEEGEVPEGRSPMRHVKPPKVPENPPDVLHESDIRALLVACEGRTFEDRRDAALVWTLYDTGIRLAECAGLELDDVDVA